MRRIPREEVERVCRRLGLVAVDPAGRLYRATTGGWAHEA